MGGRGQDGAPAHPLATARDGVAIQLQGVPCLTTGGARKKLPALLAVLLLLAVRSAGRSRDAAARLLWPGRSDAVARAALRQCLLRGARLAGRPLLQPGRHLALAAGVTHDLDTPPAPGAAPVRLLEGLAFDDRPALARLLAAERDAFAAHSAATAAPQAPNLPRAGSPSVPASARRQAPPPTAGPDRAAVWSPDRLIGRDAEIAQADAAWAAGLDVVLCGPPGSGRSRLLAGLAQRWRVTLVLRVDGGACAGPMGLPGQLARQLLGLPQAAALAPEMETETGRPAAAPTATGGWPAPDDPLAGLRWLADPALAPCPPGSLHPERLATWLAAGLQRAGVRSVALDDCSDTDADGRTLLAALAGRRTARPVQWLLAARDADPAPAPPADAVGPPWPAAHRHVRLGPWGIDALRALLLLRGPPSLDVEAWSDALHRAADGRPAAVLQLVAAAALPAGLPLRPPRTLPSMAAACQRIVARASAGGPHDAAAAAALAIAGAPLLLPVLAEVIGCSVAEAAASVQRLQAAGVLDGDHRHTQAGLASAALQCLPDGQAAQLRQRLAGAMLRSLDHAHGLAAWCETAGRWVAAGGHWARAAEEAAAQGRREPSARLWGRAAQAWRRAGVPGRAFQAEGQAVRQQLHGASAAAALPAARSLLARAVGRWQRGQAEGLLAEVLAHQHDPQALPHAQAARSLLARAPLALRSRAALQEAAALQVVGRIDEALAALLGAGRGLLALDAEARLGAVTTQVALLSALGRRREAVAAADAALASALLRCDRAAAAELASARAVQLSYQGRAAEALGAFELAIALQRSLGALEGDVLVDVMSLAGLQLDMGRLQLALDTATQAARQLEGAGLQGWAINAWNTVAHAHLLLGQEDSARRCLADLPADAAPTWARALRLAAQARLQAWTGGDPGPPATAALVAFEQGGALFQPYARERVMLEVARWGPADGALSRAAACRQWAVVHEHAALAQTAALVQLQAALALDARDCLAATLHWLDGAQAGGAEVVSLYLPELWLARADAAARLGREDEAAALARAGLAWVQKVAREGVAPAHRAGFLHRNPVNRRLAERCRATDAARPPP